MIERVNDVVAALFVAQDFEGAVGDDLVGVHVGRGACPALDDIHDKFTVILSGDDFVAGAGNGVGNVERQ